MSTHHRRRLPVGAEVMPRGGVHFRVWAPCRKRVEVVFDAGDSRSAHPAVPLEAESDGYFSAVVAQARPGWLYRYRLDGAEAFPDPASRFQPEGPHGPSEVIDPSTYSWSDANWKGRSLKGQVLYEMHLGTFTPEGDLPSAARQLPELADLGITVVELMPVAEFAGQFGWGYDGVDLFAPTRLYGRPDDLRRFIDQAHQCGIAVILDVVYNHLGPDGNYLKEFSPTYFSKRYKTDWGEAINFDGEESGPVREFFIANAAYWIDEFHFDGLRLDATQNIYDASEDHVLRCMTREVRSAAKGRATILVAENEPQECKLVRPLEAGGYGIDGLWNDDFHHSAWVALSGHNEAYYSDYRGAPQEFVSAAKYGYLYQGQWYSWQKQRRGTSSLDLDRSTFVTFIQNHDQIANSATGQRGHSVSHPGTYRAMTALLLLAPGTPMLFQGQEFASSSPFYYFADHRPELAEMVDRGRREFLAQFPSMAAPETQEIMPRPSGRETFERCKLDFSEREKHAGTYQLHRDLLTLRRDDAVFNGSQMLGLDGAVLDADAFLLRYFAEGGADRLLLVNLGVDLALEPAPEPLLGPPGGAAWKLLWSSEEPCYGGGGTPALDGSGKWRLPGRSALVLIPERRNARKQAAGKQSAQ